MVPSRSNWVLVVCGLLISGLVEAGESQSRSNSVKRNRKPVKHELKVNEQPNVDANAGQNRAGPAQMNNPLDEVRKMVPNDWKPTRMGIGLDIGSNAAFGNALTFHYDLLPIVELRAGLGYNMSGGKAGVGAGGKLPLGIFGLIAGSGLVRSSANSDKVRVPAKFTPAGSNTAEEVTAMRNFRISESTYSTTYMGGYMDLGPMFRVSAELNWNKVTAGNEVELSGETEFDQPIEVTNEDEMLPDFNSAARKKLDINGPGISIGFQYRM